MADVPAEAVGAVNELFPCRCGAEWLERGQHFPECLHLYVVDVLDLLRKARAQWLAEVDAALRDDERFGKWWDESDQTEDGAVARYLADVLGTGDETKEQGT